MRLTIIHPCIGRRPGERYIRTWQMEPLPAATIAGLTPRDVEVRFYDDRMETIPFDEPTDLVAISVETYTAKRAYQIASEYRRRGVPVVMGGFHADACARTRSRRYAEAVVIGEAEEVWPRGASTISVTDACRSSIAPKAPVARRPAARPLDLPRQTLSADRPRRSRPRLPLQVRLLRRADVFGATQTRRPADDILAEIAAIGTQEAVFLRRRQHHVQSGAGEGVFSARSRPLESAGSARRASTPPTTRNFSTLLVRSGCQGVLIGFESLEPREPGGDEQDVQHDARRLRKALGEPAAHASASTARSFSATTATRPRASPKRWSSPRSTACTSPRSTT